MCLMQCKLPLAAAVCSDSIGNAAHHAFKEGRGALPAMHGLLAILQLPELTPP